MSPSILPFFAHKPEKPPPKRVYQKVAELGIGRFGVVTKVKSQDKEYARKEILLNDEDDKHRTRVANEVANLRRVKHPNIVKYVDVDYLPAEFGQPAMVRLYMEYCKDGDIWTYVQRQIDQEANSRHVVNLDSETDISLFLMNPPSSKPQRVLKRSVKKQPEKWIWECALQLASAVAHCHYGIYSRGRNIFPKDSSPQWEAIIHRDISPKNIFLVFNEKKEVAVKLGDFGFSTTSVAGPSRSSSIGTPNYIAPEVAEGNDQVEWTLACDVYSMGCVLHFMCTGKTPNHLHDQQQREIESSIPDYSQELKDLIVKCSQEAPEDRPNVCEIYNTANSVLLNWQELPTQAPTEPSLGTVRRSFNHIRRRPTGMAERVERSVVAAFITSQDGQELRISRQGTSLTPPAFFS